MPDLAPQNPSPSAALPKPRNRRQTAAAFALGAILAGLAALFAFQGGASANIAAAPPSLVAPPDPRLEHLLSLAESQRDCDAACLGELRLRADKAAALEQALGNVQAAAAEAGQRVAALEAEKNSLEEQTGQQATALGESHKRQIEALEKEKAGLAAQMERQKAELEAGHKKQVAALEQRLAAAESQLQAARQAQEHAAPERLARQAPVPPTKVEKPATRQAAANPPAGNAANAPVDAAKPKWTVLGMTASTVVVSTPDRRVVALAAGESLDGVTVRRIDLDKGVAETSGGSLAYKK